MQLLHNYQIASGGKNERSYIYNLLSQDLELFINNHLGAKLGPAIPVFTELLKQLKIGRKMMNESEMNYRVSTTLAKVESGALTAEN